MSYNTLQKRADHIYYNVIITNTSGVAIPATYFETRTVPIINNCEDYYMSIIKFTIPTENLPLINDWYNGTGSTATINQMDGYSVTIGTGATFSQVFVQYQPIHNYTDSSDSLPTGNFQSVYFYQQLVEMINTALVSAYTNAGLTHQPPFLSFDPATQLFILYYDTRDQGSAFSIWFNTNLAYLFSSFPFEIFNHASVSYTNGGMYAQLPTDIPLLQTGVPVSPTGSTFTAISQEYPATIALFEPRQFRFITGAVPARRELVPTVQTNVVSNPILNQTNIGSNLSNNNEQAILTDFDLPLSNSVAEIRPFVQYFPTAQYRYVDLQTQGPLNQFDLSIFWVDEIGQVYPLYINPNQSCLIKVLFQRK